MWDRLTPAARQVMDAALDEADQFGHDHIGDEHVLLGLLRAGTRTTQAPCERSGSTSSRYGDTWRPRSARRPSEPRYGGQAAGRGGAAADDAAPRCAGRRCSSNGRWPSPRRTPTTAATNTSAPSTCCTRCYETRPTPTAPDSADEAASTSPNSAGPSAPPTRPPPYSPRTTSTPPGCPRRSPPRSTTNGDPARRCPGQPRHRAVLAATCSAAVLIHLTVG